MLDIQHIRKSYGVDVILEDVTFQVGDGERVGLVGRNGTGKTTLLQILTGRVPPDSGAVVKSRDMRIGYLTQDLGLTGQPTVYEAALEVFRHLLDLEDEIHRVTGLISEASRAGDMDEAERLTRRLAARQDEFERMGGYEFRSRTRGVLAGLGFTDDRLGQKASTLSGGEKTRLNMARLLLSEPDCLLLDEPTNHLDVIAVEWLEGFLSQYRKSFIVVSHDRYFLDRCATKIIELEDGTARSYPGNYTRFTELKQERFEREMKEWELQQKDLARRQEIIDRFMQYGLNFHKKAKSKARLLEKVERVDRPKSPAPVMGLKLSADRSGDQVLIATDLAKSYGGLRLFSGLNLRLTRGDRVAIVGRNGAGKSTLLKVIARKIEPDSGSVVFGSGVSLGYFDQESSGLDPDADVLTSFLQEVDIPPKEARNHLGAFLFRGDDVQKQVGVLSGGEKSRLRLAIVVAKNPNLLILDEPTNHLDIQSIEALESALEDFTGTLLFVSHDRYFVNQVADRVIEIEDGRATEYYGDYDYYVEKKRSLREKGALSEQDSGSEATTPPARQRYSEPDGESSSQATRGKSDYEARKQLRARRQALERRKKEAEDLEESIARHEAEVHEKKERLGDPDVYGDYQRFQGLASEVARLEKLVEDMYSEWEYLMRFIETEEEALSSILKEDEG